MSTVYDVIIIGGGAAGLSAAVYTGRAQLKTLILEQLSPGGQLMLTSDIENYPGFPNGVLGPDLTQRMEEQALRFGAEIRYDTVENLDLRNESKVVLGAEGQYTTKSLIIATGGEHNKLEIPGEDDLVGRGVSYCATCDGNFFSGLETVIVGGGDAALDEGLYLSRIAGKVTVVHRRDELRASKILQLRAFATPNIEFKWSHAVREIHGSGAVERVLLEDLKQDKRYEFDTSAVFIYVGFHPNSAFLQGAVPLDNGGHVVTNIRMETPVSGVFACGDIRQFSDRQLGNSVGDGITAALSAYRYLAETD
jgi:thioredoxin reductase (NADPH)